MAEQTEKRYLYFLKVQGSDDIELPDGYVFVALDDEGNKHYARELDWNSFKKMVGDVDRFCVFFYRVFPTYTLPYLYAVDMHTGKVIETTDFNTIQQVCEGIGVN